MIAIIDYNSYHFQKNPVNTVLQPLYLILF